MSFWNKFWNHPIVISILVFIVAGLVSLTAYLASDSCDIEGNCFKLLPVTDSLGGNFIPDLMAPDGNRYDIDNQDAGTILIPTNSLEEFEAFVGATNVGDGRLNTNLCGTDGPQIIDGDSVDGCSNCSEGASCTSDAACGTDATCDGYVPPSDVRRCRVYDGSECGGEVPSSWTSVDCTNDSHICDGNQNNTSACAYDGGGPSDFNYTIEYCDLYQTTPAVDGQCQCS